MCAMRMAKNECSVFNSVFTLSSRISMYLSYQPIFVQYIYEYVQIVKRPPKYIGP